MEVKIIAYVLIGIFLGPLVSLVVTPIFCILRKIFFVPFIRKNLRKKAEQEGHVVKAFLQKSHNIKNHELGFGPMATMRDMGTYTYQVNGKNYTYRHISSNTLPDSITLYYIKKPSKATVSNDLGNWESPWLKFFLIISFLVSIATVVVGMVMG